jgi:hypothetical protein
MLSRIQWSELSAVNAQPNPDDPSSFLKLFEASQLQRSAGSSTLHFTACAVHLSRPSRPNVRSLPIPEERAVPTPTEEALMLSYGITVMNGMYVMSF